MKFIQLKSLKLMMAGLALGSLLPENTLSVPPSLDEALSEAFSGLFSGSLQVGGNYTVCNEEDHKAYDTLIGWGKQHYADMDLTALVESGDFSSIGQTGAPRGDFPLERLENLEKSYDEHYGPYAGIGAIAQSLSGYQTTTGRAYTREQRADFYLALFEAAKSRGHLKWDWLKKSAKDRFEFWRGDNDPTILSNVELEAHEAATADASGIAARERFQHLDKAAKYLYVWALSEPLSIAADWNESPASDMAKSAAVAEACRHNFDLTKLDLRAEIALFRRPMEQKLEELLARPMPDQMDTDAYIKRVVGHLSLYTGAVTDKSFHPMKEMQHTYSSGIDAVKYAIQYGTRFIKRLIQKVYPGANPSDKLDEVLEKTHQTELYKNTFSFDASGHLSHPNINSWYWGEMVFSYEALKNYKEEHGLPSEDD